MGLRQFDKALAVLNEGLKQSPGSAAIREQLAETTAIAGDYSLAIVRFQELIAQDPKSAQLRLRLAQTYQGSGDQKNALLSYQQAHDLAPDEASRHLLAAVLINGSREIQPEQVDDAFHSLRHSRLERRQRELRRSLAEAELRNDTAAVQELMTEKMALDRVLRDG